MHFTQLIKSLDELLYEVMSWVVFYPLTLWRVFRRPLHMMDYSDRELHQQDAAQYTETLAPPLFLLLSLLLSHALELAIIGNNPIVASKHGLAALVDDDSSLIALRLVIFSVFPLLFALRLVRAQHKPITRETLRQPFYAQCYAAAPFALMLGVGTVFASMHWHEAAIAGWTLTATTLLAYWMVQARWFAQHLGKPVHTGVAHAAIAFLESTLLIIPFATLFV